MGTSWDLRGKFRECRNSLACISSDALEMFEKRLIMLILIFLSALQVPRILCPAVLPDRGRDHVMVRMTPALHCSVECRLVSCGYRFETETKLANARVKPLSRVNVGLG